MSEAAPNTRVRISSVLADAKTQNRAALIGYLPVGFPTKADSLRAFTVLVEAGVDIVEVGMPYSDPLMDGPVIQAAAEQARVGGIRTADVFDAVQAVSGAGGAAAVMSYWNLIEQYGLDRFASSLAAAGGSGVITPDLIPDEADGWIQATTANDVDRIFLVAPSSTDARLTSTAAASSGFVYAASTMGVTGARTNIGDAARILVDRTRAVTDMPVCVGLGVSTRDHAEEIAAYADGVIVGSALVRALGDGGLPALRDLVTQLAQGVRSAR